jgi:enamine deaminase RidA (YjgF/YER057c/UK114 family)
MSRTLVSSGSYLEPIIGFSRAVRVGNIITIAGTAPIAPEGGTFAKGDAYGQMQRCIAIAEKALGDAGARLADVTRTRILVTDIAHWKEAARAHGEAFGTIRPATTVMAVTAFVDPDWLVEIEVDAVVGG